MVRHCSVCDQDYASTDVVSAAAVRADIATLIRADHPQWGEGSFICQADLGRYRTRYVQALLESERGEVTSLEAEVLRSLQQHELLAANPDAEMEGQWTAGERLADRIASFGGSWQFVVAFFVFIAGWIVVNAWLLGARPPDPYPFILLNLLLSCLAAIQAPIIMMSQNRQEAKDRLRSQHDYQVNLKAELEIRHLHEKIDHLLSHQWERLVQIQELQIELLSEINRRERAGPGVSGAASP
jgi:uncharacterized membrane protein